jgi:dTDP-4-dehydrorhamnose reductase
MTIPRILVIGANGQVGKSLAELTSMFDAEWTFVARNDLDITDATAAERFFTAQQFDFCINTAAYTQVDKAEDEPEHAFLVNSVAPGIISTLCALQDCVFMHFSTDYVYDNGLTRPLEETDPLAPASVYAKTKLEGELRAQAVNPKTVVIRTSWVFSEYGNNFVKTMARLITQGKALSVVNDQTGCPTYSRDLALAVIQIITNLNQKSAAEGVYGVYNYSNDGPTTWFDFATEIASQLHVNASISPVSTKEYGAKAARPTYSVLNTSKIRDTFAIDPPHWRDGLIRVINQLQLDR